MIDILIRPILKKLGVDLGGRYLARLNSMLLHTIALYDFRVMHSALTLSTGKIGVFQKAWSLKCRGH